MRRGVRVCLGISGEDLYSSMNGIELMAIRDAGLGLIPWLRAVFQFDMGGAAAALVRQILSTENRRVGILELGCGVGLVGIALAQMRQKFNVWVSDKADAIEILGINTENTYTADATSLTPTTIDWEEELFYKFQDMRFDLILVCDCTYNTDGMPALVEKLRELAEISKDPEMWTGPYVLMSTKVRHSSEVIFFDMMEKAGFVQLEHTSVDLPDRLRIERGEDLEVADIYIFQPKGAQGNWSRVCMGESTCNLG
jgi:SAM-dependent methyltransferase